MTSSDELFLLIKSLSKQEKRYFKLFSAQHIIGEENNYIKLFDAIESQKKYDEDAVIGKFKGQVFIKHISSMKVYLYNLILKSLRNYNSKNTINDQLLSQYKNAEELFNRGFYKHGLKILLKAKKMAEQEERYSFLPEILRLERKFTLALGTRTDLKEIADHIEDSKRIFHYLELELEYEHLNNKLWYLYRQHGYIRQEKEAKIFHDFLKDPLLTTEKKAVTYQSKFYLHSILGLAYSIIGDLQKSKYSYKKIVDLMHQYPNSIKDNTSGYILACGNLLNSHLRLDEHEDHYKVLNELKSLNKENISINAQCRQFEVTALHELLYKLNTGDFSSADKIISDIQENLTYWGDRLIKDIANTIHYYCAYVYLCSDDPKKAITCLNRLTNLPENQVRPELLGAAKILSLFIYIELGDLDLLFYINKSVYRYFNNKQKLFPFEKVIIEFVRKKASSKNKSDHTISDLEKLRENLLKVHEKSEGNYMLEYFDISSWLDSRIEKRPVSEIIRKKKKLKR